MGIWRAGSLPGRSGSSHRAAGSFRYAVTAARAASQVPRSTT